MEWAKAPASRRQLTTLPHCFDDDIPADHDVRLVDMVLGQLDWAPWEAAYKREIGRPPIHPRVLAGIILYGTLRKLKSSRALEAALRERLDFRWLAEGRSIDHSTIAEFAIKHHEQLRAIFTSTVRVAIELGWTQLEMLAFDGTRISASNHRSRTRTPEELRELDRRLGERFDQLRQEGEAADRRWSANEEACRTRQQNDIAKKQQAIAAALKRLEELRTAGAATPARLPLTDLDARVMPNKHGGCAPNYTPLATVDVATGLMVAADVIASTEEDKELVPAILDVRATFGARAGSIALADGLMATGANLERCEQEKIDLYAPTGLERREDDPTRREDPRQPVPTERHDRLPTEKRGRTGRQLSKQAFVYDAAADCYWCPQGKALTYRQTTKEKKGKGFRERRRYRSNKQDCAGCVLKALCLQGKSVERGISREPHEDRREAQAAKMSTPSGRERYAKRRHAGERPFAMIKEEFGARRFRTRGREKVRQAWTWLATAFNLTILMRRMRGTTGPPQRVSIATS